MQFLRLLSAAATASTLVFDMAGLYASRIETLPLYEDVRFALFVARRLIRVDRRNAVSPVSSLRPFRKKRRLVGIVLWLRSAER